jgi:hypothetical protein
LSVSCIFRRIQRENTSDRPGIPTLVILAVAYTSWRWYKLPNVFRAPARKAEAEREEKTMIEPPPEHQKPELVIRAPLSEDGFISIYFSSPDGRLMNLTEWWHLKQLVELTSKMCVKQGKKARAASA